MTIPPDTLVIAAGHFGNAIRPERHGTADGYIVSTSVPGTGDGYLPHWVPDWCVNPAALDVNVCRTRRGQCFCGLVHVDATELAWLQERAS